MPYPQIAVQPKRCSTSASSVGGVGEPPIEICTRDVRSRAVHVGVLEQGGRHGRHQEEAGDPLVLDQTEDGLRVEPGEHHVHRAERGHVVRCAPPVDVEQRDRVQDHVVALQAVRERGVDRVQVEAAVGEHRPLRRSGAPRRVEDLGHGPLVHLRGRRHGWAAGRPAAPRGCRPGDLGGRAARVGLVRVPEQHRSTTVLEHQPQLGSRQPDVQGHEDRPRRSTEVRLEQLVGVAAEPGHPVARPDVEAVAERPGQAVRTGPELPVGEAPVALHHPDPIGEQAPGPGQEVEGSEGELHRSGPRPAGPGAAAGQHVPEQRRSVGHEPVHASIEQLVHLRFVVDRPDVHLQPEAVGGWPRSARR